MQVYDIKRLPHGSVMEIWCKQQKKGFDLQKEVLHSKLIRLEKDAPFSGSNPCFFNFASHTLPREQCNRKGDASQR